jgi:hypothetical protein
MDLGLKSKKIKHKGLNLNLKNNRYRKYVLAHKNFEYFQNAIKHKKTR